MRVEGDVGLDLVVWLSHAADAIVGQRLARALPGSEWIASVGDRARVHFRGSIAEIEERSGAHFAGVIVGRVRADGDTGDTAPFRPFARESGAMPLRLESCWFALDTTGAVACFDRDQLGAAPIKRCWGPRPAPPLVLDSVASRIEGLLGHHAAPHPAAPTYAFVTDPDRLAAGLAGQAPRGAERRWTLAHDDARVLVSTASVAASANDSLPPAFVGWLHARKLCLGCARSSLHDPRLRGVYVYRHVGRDRAAPYDRVDEPAHAWNATTAASQLSLRVAALEAFVLPVRFAEKPRLQPIEYAACTWSDTVPWESESGERHGAPAGLRGR